MANMLSTEAQNLLRTWGCPESIISICEEHSLSDGLWGTWADEDNAYWMGLIRKALDAINGYHEHTSAIMSAVIARQADALREWANSDAWEEAGRETSDEPETEGPQYARDVCRALSAIAEAIESK